MSLRNERVRKTLMKEIADIIQREVRDPRITGVVSIVDVEMSQDNSYAKVIYSVFSTDEEAKAKTIEALNANKPHIRYELGKRIRLRHTPDLRFIASDTRW
jgi:ribosome-binding factor A